MNLQVVSTLIAAGSDIISQLIRNRTVHPPPLTDISTLYPSEIKEEKKKKLFSFQRPAIVNPIVIAPQQVIAEQEADIAPAIENKSTAVATGCIPCSLGHFGTCTGLLNEATRFARGPEGVAGSEVIDRVNLCLDELNSLEREDLRPEKLTQLNGWERELADNVLKASRQTRHELEDVSKLSVQQLEDIAGKAQSERQKVGRDWFQKKIANLSQEDQTAIRERIMEKLGEIKAYAAEGQLEKEE